MPTQKYNSREKYMEIKMGGMSGIGERNLRFWFVEIIYTRKSTPKHLSLIKYQELESNWIFQNKPLMLTPEERREK